MRVYQEPEEEEVLTEKKSLFLLPHPQASSINSPVQANPSHISL